MRVFTGGGATTASRVALSWQRVAGTLLLTLAVAGCGSTGQTPFLADAAGATVALESIDGPPLSVFHKFVRDLNEEAATRQIAVAPRGGSAPYRLRGYLAVYAEDGTPAIAWAWDIYDAAEHRAFRIQGQERAGAGRTSWAAADDEVLRRIARVSMEQVAVFIASARAPGTPVAEAAAIVAERGVSLLATFDDFRPEAAGIFRLLRNEPAPTNDGASATGSSPQPETFHCRDSGLPRPARRRYSPSPIPAGDGWTAVTVAENPGQQPRSYCQPRRLLVIRAPRVTA
jgi:hypothetical protein